MATERVNHPKADFIAYNINERLYVACRAANGGYADVVAAGEFVERSALRAPSGGLFLVPVSAHGSANDRNCAFASTTRLTALRCSEWVAVWPAPTAKALLPTPNSEEGA
jgi:hypothetical protein